MMQFNSSVREGDVQIRLVQLGELFRQSSSLSWTLRISGRRRARGVGSLEDIESTCTALDASCWPGCTCWSGCQQVAGPCQAVLIARHITISSTKGDLRCEASASLPSVYITNRAVSSWHAPNTQDETKRFEVNSFRLWLFKASQWWWPGWIMASGRRPRRENCWEDAWRRGRWDFAGERQGQQVEVPTSAQGRGQGGSEALPGGGGGLHRGVRDAGELCPGPLPGGVGGVGREVGGGAQDQGEGGGGGGGDLFRQDIGWGTAGKREPVSHPWLKCKWKSNLLFELLLWNLIQKHQHLRWLTENPMTLVHTFTQRSHQDFKILWTCLEMCYDCLSHRYKFYLGQTFCLQRTFIPRLIGSPFSKSGPYKWALSVGGLKRLPG